MIASGFAHDLTVLGSLGAACLLSPEVFLLGLVLAGDDAGAKSKSISYFIGTAAGIAAAMTIGLSISGDGLHLRHHPSWHAFIIRAGLGIALLWLGIERAREYWKQLRGLAPSVEKQAGMLKQALAHWMPVGGNSPLSRGRALWRCFELGAFVGAVNPKRLPICIAAGHQMSAMAPASAQVSGAVIFLVLALLPSFLPAAMAVSGPAAARRLRAKFDAVVERHGLAIVALILIILGVHFLHTSIGVYPA